MGMGLGWAYVTLGFLASRSGLGRWVLGCLAVNLGLGAFGLGLGLPLFRV